MDDSSLSISSREGIEIDFCPQCRGVWLDRGELDKIIERASTSLAPTGGGTSSPQERYDERRDERRYDDRREHDRREHDRRDYDDDHSHGRRKKKKRSFLEDIFEFGGD